MNMKTIIKKLVMLCVICLFTLGIPVSNVISEETTGQGDGAAVEQKDTRTPEQVEWDKKIRDQILKKQEELRNKVPTKLTDSLERLVLAYEKGGMEKVYKLAEKHPDIKRNLTENNRINVTIFFTIPMIEFNDSLLQQYGIPPFKKEGMRPKLRSGTVSVPIDMLRKLSEDIPEIEFINLPGGMRLLSGAYQSQGVSLTGALSYAYYTGGAGIKVVISDY